jgi:hypothetical protein
MAQNAQSRGPVTVAIVCGYDLDSDLGAYVEKVARRLDGIHLDAIVLSGGRTHPTIDSSEAREMSRHLAELRPHGTVLLDHEAMNTLDNLVHARELVKESFATPHDYLICCDVAHALKAWILARLVLRGRIRMLAVPRSVPLYIWLREPFSIVMETLGALLPPLRAWLSRGAARMKGVTWKQRRSTRPEAALAVAPPHRPLHTSGTAAPPDPPAPLPRA